MIKILFTQILTIILYGHHLKYKIILYKILAEKNFSLSSMETQKIIKKIGNSRGV